MFSIKNWSLRGKIVSIGVLLPSILLICLFVMYYAQSKDKAIESYVEKARSICLTAESTRQEMEDKWDMDIITTGMLREWAEGGEMDKVLAGVPVVSAWNAAMRKAEEGGYKFKVPKVDPRNPKNEPDELEARALAAMKADNLSEYYEVDESINSIRYFRPVKLTKTCMPCHGDPKNSMELWGNDQGLDPTGTKMENWEIGTIHGAFEVIQSLDTADAALVNSLKTAAIMVVLGLAVSGIIFFFVIRMSVDKPIDNISQSLLEGSDGVSSAASQVSSSSQSLAEGASSQAAGLEEVSASLEEMSSMTRQNADNAQEASALAGEAQKSASSGMDSMEKMNSAIDEIQKSSGETAKIIKVIDEIAFQTNLLALNAAVEAARAGEAGKGFAVVAEEVRNLAMRSAEAAKNTSVMIEESVKNAENGVNITKEVGEALSQIVEGISKTSDLVGEIAAASKEQSDAVSQVNGALSQMENVTQANAAGAEESSSAAEELNAQAQTLNDIVNNLVVLVKGSNGQAGASRSHAAALGASDLAYHSISQSPKSSSSGNSNVSQESAEAKIPLGDDKGNFDEF